jgi:hypothetical protein
MTPKTAEGEIGQARTQVKDPPPGSEDPLDRRGAVRHLCYGRIILDHSHGSFLDR